MAQRYIIDYGDERGSLSRYVVWDKELGKVAYAHDSKSVCIFRSQELNGFEPVDGDEQTYGKQAGGTMR